MAASDHLSPAQFYTGRSGLDKVYQPGDTIGTEHGRMNHVYYTSHLPTATHHATDMTMDDDNPRPGHVYAVQPETNTGRKIGRHAPDPWSGVAEWMQQAYRTKGRLRVLHEVHPKTGERLG